MTTPTTGREPILGALILLLACACGGASNDRSAGTYAATLGDYDQTDDDTGADGSDGDAMGAAPGHARVNQAGLLEEERSNDIAASMRCPDGAKVTTREDGFVTIIGCVRPDGRRHGPEIWLDESTHRRTSEYEYVDGVLEGKVVLYYDDGRKKQESHFLGGVEHGTIKTWYPDGVLRGEGEYERGNNVGRWTTYWPNGNPMQRGMFVDGKTEGLWTMWDEQGVMYQEMTYRRGEPVSGTAYRDGLQVPAAKMARPKECAAALAKLDSLGGGGIMEAAAELQFLTICPMMVTGDEAQCLINAPDVDVASVCLGKMNPML